MGFESSRGDMMLSIENFYKINKVIVFDYAHAFFKNLSKKT